MKVIGRHAFTGCTSLASIVVDEGNSVYHSSGNCLIETKSKTLIKGCKNSMIPDRGVASIGDWAFGFCEGLTSISIPNRVTSIGSCSFECCHSLISVIIGSNVTSIEFSAFNGCSSLTSVIIPDSVTHIDSNAFSDCTGLTSITIPDSVEWIGAETFENCTALTSITIPDSVTHIGERAFFGCKKLCICYDGTIAQWNRVGKYKWAEGMANKFVRCRDGIVTI